MGKLTILTWTSTQVPLFGLVKRVKLDKNAVELERTVLLEWGESGGAERPLVDKP
jgi:hypothetical protein